MRYSLSNRFRGAVLGAAIAELWGNVHPPDIHATSWLTPAQASEGTVTGALAWNVSQGILEGTEGLIQGHMVAYAGQPPINHPDSPPDLAQAIEIGDGLTDAATLKTRVGTLVAIALFFHDDLDSLRRAIAIWISDAKMDSVLADVFFVFAYSLSLALRDQLHPNHWLPTLLNALTFDAKLAHTTRPNAVQRKLNQVQHLLHTRAGLAAVEKLVRDSPNSYADSNLAEGSHESWMLLNSMAIALYSFISTPEDFRLTVVRSRLSQYETQTTCAIAGALSGAYVGISGLPIDWRSQLQALGTSKHFLTSSHPTSVESALLNGADRLLASWSGIYNPESQAASLAAVSAPNIIRPR